MRPLYPTRDRRHVFGWSASKGRVSHVDQKCSFVDNLCSTRSCSKDGSSRSCGVVTGHVFLIGDNNTSGGYVLA